MFISIGDIKYHVKATKAESEIASLIMLHGFGGTGDVFNDISTKLVKAGISTVVVDLPGHGRTEAELDPQLFSIQSQVKHLRALLYEMDLDRSWLYGYSMGGRIGLRIATKTDLNLSGLILESAQLGISDANERVKRLSADKILAAKLRNDATHFFDAWNRLPLFYSGSALKSDSVITFERIQQSQNPDALALSLEYMSPGYVDVTKPSQLDVLPFPVLVLTGKIDKKYDSFWTKISMYQKHIDHIRIDKSGHRIHLDQPELLSKELIHYIKSKTLNI